MSGIPKTLPGIVGFMIFAAFLLGEVVVDSPFNEDTQQQIIELNDNMARSLNQTAEPQALPPIAILNSLGLGVASIQLILGYLSIFMGYSGIAGLPPEFLIFFLILSLGAVISIIKLIRGVAEIYL